MGNRGIVESAEFRELTDYTDISRLAWGSTRAKVTSVTGEKVWRLVVSPAIKPGRATGISWICWKKIGAGTEFAPSKDVKFGI